MLSRSTQRHVHTHVVAHIHPHQVLQQVVQQPRVAHCLARLLPQRRPQHSPVGCQGRGQGRSWRRGGTGAILAVLHAALCSAMPPHAVSSHAMPCHGTLPQPLALPPPLPSTCHAAQAPQGIHKVALCSVIPILGPPAQRVCRWVVVGLFGQALQGSSLSSAQAVFGGKQAVSTGWGGRRAMRQAGGKAGIVSGHSAARELGSQCALGLWLH